MAGVCGQDWHLGGGRRQRCAIAMTLVVVVVVVELESVDAEEINIDRSATATAAQLNPSCHSGGAGPSHSRIPPSTVAPQIGPF